MAERSYVTYAANRLWVLAVEFDQQLVGKEIMQQYDDNGTILADMTLQSNTSTIYGVCSDNINAYKISSDGLYKVDINGNVSQIASLWPTDVFRVNDPNGSNHKIAVTDHTNQLKLFDR